MCVCVCACVHVGWEVCEFPSFLIPYPGTVRQTTKYNNKKLTPSTASI
jgi:hypothetical protein